MTTSSADVVVPIVMKLVNPHSVVDVGCGPGVWGLAFIQNGVKDVLGIDGQWHMQQLIIPKENFVAHDLNFDLKLDRRFDLAVCLEVAEHLPRERAEGFVSMLTGYSDVVLFSAAIPSQGGDYHINGRWQDYWAALFSRRGFIPVDFRHEIWKDERVVWWYAQNMLLYVKEAKLETMPLVKNLWKQTRLNQLSIVHPKMLASVFEIHNILYAKVTRPLRKLLKRYMA